jgi:cytoskeletal protein RodZ
VVVDHQDNSASTLIWVVVIILLIGFGVWWWTTHPQTPTPAAPQQNQPALNVNVTVPSGDASNGTTPAPNSTTPAQ